MRNAENFLLSGLEVKASIFHFGQYCDRWEASLSLHSRAGFHLVLHGPCWVHFPELPSICLQPGEAVFFLRDVAHVLSPSADKPDFSHPLNHQLMQPLSEDATSSTGLLCGFLSFQPGLTDLLLAALPDTLLLAGPDLLASETRTVFDLIMSEMRAEQEVNPLVIERLVELLLFYTLRYYAEHGHANYALPYGVLELAKDNAYGPLLSAIVREPALAWSVDDMADFLHTSRASFHRRFTLLSGLAPAQLLLNIRVQLSKALLTEGLSVEQVAERMGYASAPTFSNAFKRVMGLTPSVWRDGK